MIKIDAVGAINILIRTRMSKGIISRNNPMKYEVEQYSAAQQSIVRISSLNMNLTS